MRAWYDNLIHFCTNSLDGSYFVEGFVTSDDSSEVVWHCWTGEPDGVTDVSDWGAMYHPVYKYSYEEIMSLVDLIDDGSYPLPLSVSYGPPKFTPAMLRLLPYHKSIKADDEYDYDAPIGPSRRRGRPRRYNYEDEVDSSNLEKVEFDKRSETLTVTFRSGRKYEYYGVPFKRYQYLVKRAPSKGKYFHKKIRFSYPYREI